MPSLTIDLLDQPRQLLLGNSAEMVAVLVQQAQNYAGAAEDAATEAAMDSARALLAADSATALAAGLANYRATKAECIATIPVGEYCTSPEGYTYPRLYKRISTSPFLEDQGEVGSAISKALIGGDTGASYIGYLPTGTGAVSRTAEQKFGETYTVKDFGAVGDGATNDRTKLQAAIDAANARYVATGDPVWLEVPHGDYVVDASVNLKSGVHLRGPGKIRRINNATAVGSAFALLVGSGITNFSVKGLSFENVVHSRAVSISQTTCTVTVGSNILTSVASMTNMVIGNWVYIQGIGQRQITGVSGSTVTFSGSAPGAGTGGSKTLWAVLGTSVATGSGNTCIDVRGCSNFTIEGNDLGKFSVGILHQGCANYTITGNRLDAQTGKTIAQMIAGTYTDFTWGTAPAYQGTGGIIALYASGGIPAANYNFTITNNIVEIPGLDMCIEGLEQAYDRAPGVISGNVTRGGNSGIQTYRGSFADPGTATTYDSALLVANNIIQYTWQQGIYHRMMLGGTFIGNRLYRTGMGGSDGTASITGMCFRVNPMPANATNASVTAGKVSNDLPIVVMGNVIVDHGTLSGSSDAAVSLEIDNVEFRHNVIVRTNEFASVGGTASVNRVGSAILIANGKLIERGACDYNTIIGTFVSGIDLTDIIGKRVRNCAYTITGNKIFGDYTDAIKTDWYGINLRISDNMVNATASGSGIRYMRSPRSVIAGNTVIGTFGTGAIVDAGVNLSSDFAYLLSGGTVGNSWRRGTTMIVNRNTVWTSDESKAFVATNGNGFDATFQSRCASLIGNTVNGRPYEYTYANATAPATFSPKSWHRADMVRANNPSATQPLMRTCWTAGTYGDTSNTATGDTTSGSRVITNVSSLNSYGPGMYIQPTGFSSPAYITDVDTTANTITVDAQASSTNTGVALTIPAPTFGSILGYSSGWAADTGTQRKAANTVYAKPTISASYSQAQVQAIADSLQDVSQTVAAIKKVLTDAGMIGA